MGGSGVGLGGQSGCERRIEVFVKIQKKNWGGRGSGWGVRVDVDEELKFLFGGGSVGGRGEGSGWM